MSSTITIGFLDRTSVRIYIEYTRPIADNERRELLIHAALLTARALASLTPERQRAFAGVLREWKDRGFDTCPLQISEGDPMVCPHRFAATFLAPVREYALATTGCGKAAGGMDYFLPMAAAAYLRHVADHDHDPDELLKPALALCTAALSHPVTLENHFQMAAASLPKIEPIRDRTLSRQERPVVTPAPLVPLPIVAEESERPLPRHETTRSLIVSACLAATLIVFGVQYCSTRESSRDGETAVVHSSPAPQAAPQFLPLVPSPPQHEGTADSPTLHEPVHSVVESVVETPPVAPRKLPLPLSPQARVYLREARDLAENSLAQVRVMAAAAGRGGTGSEELVETLDYGMRTLQSWQRQVAVLAPPARLAESHQEIIRIMLEMNDIAQAIQPQLSHAKALALRDRLDRLHAELARILNEADAG